MDMKLVRLIQEKVTALPRGATFDVSTVMGDEWASVQSKQSFGRQFKAAVMNGRLAGLEHHELNNSPRRDIYRKV
jgi:hypothetical protein